MFPMPTLRSILLCPIRRRILRAADTIDREHPGPHLPGTVGAAFADFAMKLRAFAATLT